MRTLQPSPNPWMAAVHIAKLRTEIRGFELAVCRWSQMFFNVSFSHGTQNPAVETKRSRCQTGAYSKGPASPLSLPHI